MTYYKYKWTWLIVEAGTANIDGMSNDYLKLTEREENFSQFYAIDGRPSAAYRHAYSTSNCTAQTVSANAQQVLNRPHVAMRIYELKTIVDKAFSISIEKKKLWLQKIIDISLQTKDFLGDEIFINDPKAAQAAINELNKMDGHLAAQKKEISGAIGISIDADDDDL